MQENYKSEADDIFYATEFLLESIRNGREAISNSIRNNPVDFQAIQSASQYGIEFQKIEEFIGNCLDSFVISDSDDDVSEEDDDRKTIPNYKEYETDTEIPHLLTESYTYKKICGFLLNGIRYNVSDWKSALVKICEILIDNDFNKFSQIMKSDDFNGKKIKYFSSQGDAKYYRKLNNADIYIWTCHSANTVCAIIRKLLREYNIPINSIYIYLRADYTPLHSTLPKIDNLSPVDSGVKIGKFVKDSMRNLSNSNYKFDSSMMAKLTDEKSTKELFGIGIPFFREVKQGKDISSQTKDSNGYNRYWKEVFNFNGKEWLIISQWTKGNADRFKSWYKDLLKNN